MGEGLKFDQKLDSALPDGLIKNLNERISTMKEAELRDRLEDARIAPKRTVPELRKQLLAVMLKEAQETPSLEKSVDVENTEPEINDEMEEKLEAEIPTSVLRVVPKDDIVEVPKTETSEEVQARVDKAKASIEARLRERERQEEIERLSPEPFKETAYSSGAELAGGRRIAYRNVDSFPFGKPKRTIEPGNKVVGYEKPDLKILQKNEPIVLPERQKLLHKDDLGKTKEVKIPEKDRVIIEAIVTGQDILEKDKDYFDADKERLIMEALRKIGEVKKLNLHEDEKEEDLEKPGANPDHIFDDVKEPEVKKEKPQPFTQERVSKNHDIDSRVDKKLRSFGLEAESFYQKNPEFFSLSAEKQIYALSKIDQKLRLKSELEAKDKVDVELAESRPKKWFYFAGHVKHGFRNLRSGHRQVSLRESLINQSKQNGVPEYQEDLKTLTSYLSEAPELSYREDGHGKLVPCFEYVKIDSLDKKQQIPRNFFNRAASKFAEIPYEWSLSSATSSQREAHRKASESYSLAKKALIRSLSEEKKTKDPELAEENRRKIISDIGQINAKVNFGRYITQNPDIENKSKLFFEKTLGGRVDERLKFIGAMALGYGTKWLGRSTAVLGIGAGVAAVAGGAMSVYKKNKEFSEKEFRARYGKADTKEIGMKKNLDSKDLYKRLESMLNQFESGVTSGGKASDKARTLERIKTRLFVNESMLGNGRVTFGSTHDEYAFSELMARAATTVEMYEDMSTEKTDVEKLFTQYKTFIGDDRASNERTKEISKAALVGAVVGATGFFAGAGMRKGIEYIKESGVFGAAWQYVTDAVEGKKMPIGGGTVRLNPTSSEYQPVNFPKNMPRPDSLPYDTNNLPEMPRTTVVAEASFGTRGAIGMIKDLQKSLWDQYGGKIPENLRAFAEGDPNKIAIGWGMYRPQDEFESIVLPKGTSLVAGNDGQVYLKGLDGNLVNMTKGGAGIEADFYDTKTGRINTGTTGDVLENKNPNTVENRLDGTPRTSERIDLENQQVIENPDMEQNAPNRSVYTENGFQGFEDYKDVSVEQGWTHTPSETGGDILSYEYEEPKPDQVVEGYSEIDGLKVETKELKGTIDFLYDSRGGIKGIDLPALQAEDVSRFRANPENFIGGSHDAAERAMLGKKLMAMNSQVETFLKYRRIMEVQSLHPDSPEYKFLHEESNKLWTAIQKKVDYQFNPEYTGFKPNPIENTVPVVEVPKEQPIDLSDNSSAPSSNERPPFVRNLSEDNIATEADLEHEKELVEAHRLEVEKGAAFEIEGNKTYAKAIEKYGEVSEIKGNIIIFEKGYVGFYGESMDEATALKKGEALARANSSIVGAQQDHIGIKQNGVNRIMYIFKKR